MGRADHGAKLHELPDHYLADAMPVAKKIAIAQGATDYNVLQNNGQIANQVCVIISQSCQLTNSKLFIVNRPCSLPCYS